MTTPNDPATPEPGPLFWMGARALTHVGEFRRYYALFAVWVLVMVAVPRADGPPRDDFVAAPTGVGVAGVSSAARVPESAAAAALSRPSSPATSTFFADPLLDAVTGPATFGAFDDDAGDAGAPSPAPTGFAFPPPPSDGVDPPPADEPAGPAISVPPPPATPLPPPPAELEPLLRVVAPLANTACSPIGLAGVVAALVGPSVQEVPVAQILPYLTPLYVACGSFPQTGPRTVCELDDAYVSQDPTGGLLPPPAIVGLGIDTIAQLEAALGGFGNQAAALRQQLNCRVGGG